MQLDKLSNMELSQYFVYIDEIYSFLQLTHNKTLSFGPDGRSRPRRNRPLYHRRRCLRPDFRHKVSGQGKYFSGKYFLRPQILS